MLAVVWNQSASLLKDSAGRIPTDGPMIDKSNARTIGKHSNPFSIHRCAERSVRHRRNKNAEEDFTSATIGWALGMRSRAGENYESEQDRDNSLHAYSGEEQDYVRCRTNPQPEPRPAVYWGTFIGTSTSHKSRMAWRCSGITSTNWMP